MEKMPYFHPKFSFFEGFEAALPINFSGFLKFPMEYICLNNRKNIVCNLKAQPSPLQKGERRGKEGAKFLAYK